MTANTPQIETERLILRKFTQADAEACFLIFKDKKANTFLPWFPLETMEQAIEFLHRRFLALYQLPCSYHYAICFKTDPRPIGYVNVSDDESHDLGYGLRSEYWHNGIVTEAVSAVVDHLREAGIPYLTATHDIHNPRSGEVMKKVGMTYRYSYEECVQPKNAHVTFRLYQLNFTKPKDWVYQKYWDKHPVHFIEERIKILPIAFR